MILTEEDEFYLPQSIRHILSNSKHEILEVVCVRNPLTSSLLDAAKKFFPAFGLIPLLRHGLRIFKARFIDLFQSPSPDKTHFSVKKICKAFNTNYSFVNEVNSEDYLNHCRELKPDLILSVSPTQIFKKKLISIPTFGCINLHSSKLPRYRGLYPCYWAMAMGDKKVGVTVHRIEEGIDTGAILLQREVEIPSHATLDEMLSRTKRLGAQMILKVADRIAEEEIVQGNYSEKEGTYFSFPTKISYQKFKKNGYRLW